MSVLPIPAFQSDFHVQCASNAISSNLMSGRDIDATTSCDAMPLDFDPQNSLCTYAYPLLSNNNLETTESHNVTQTFDLNFPTSNQFYTVSSSVVPENQLDTSTSNTLYQNASADKKPVVQIPEIPELLLPSVYCMEEHQLAGAGEVSNSVDVNIQCEVGPETQHALHADEDGKINEISDIADTSNHSQPKEGMFSLGVCNMV